MAVRSDCFVRRFIILLTEAFASNLKPRIVLLGMKEVGSGRGYFYNVFDGIFCIGIVDEKLEEASRSGSHGAASELIASVVRHFSNELASFFIFGEVPLLVAPVPIARAAPLGQILRGNGLAGKARGENCLHFRVLIKPGEND